MPNSVWMCPLRRLRWVKTTNWGKFWHWEGATVPTRFNRRGPNLVCYCRPTAYVYVPNLRMDRLIMSPSGGKKIIFAVFGLRHLVMSTVGGKLRKLTRLHNYKPSAIQQFKIVSVICLHGEIGRRISDGQKRDGHTDRQKTFLIAPAAREIRAQPNLTRW